MKSQSYSNPRLFVVKAEEFPISGDALLELMMAVLMKGVPFRFKARGWSMTPFIRDGDSITIDPIKNVPPRLGEVVAFVTPNGKRLVVHRIVRKSKELFLIRGDALSESEIAMVPRENLLGRVVGIDRKDKRVWLGLGPERVLIAWLSQIRLLIPMQRVFANLRNQWKKRFCFK